MEKISRLIKEKYDRFLFAILENTTEKFIGWVSLSDVQLKNRGANLGIAILQKEQRGQGYGFEAVSLICKFAFLMNWACTKSD